jgi:hypothetical protein
MSNFTKKIPGRVDNQKLPPRGGGEAPIIKIFEKKSLLKKTSQKGLPLKLFSQCGKVKAMNGFSKKFPRTSVTQESSL